MIGNSIGWTIYSKEKVDQFQSRAKERKPNHQKIKDYKQQFWNDTSRKTILVTIVAVFEVHLTCIFIKWDTLCTLLDFLL